MPDSPAVNFFQLSVLPVPSGVIMPMPVIATTGRPALSRRAPFAIVVASINPFNKRETLAPPMADARHQRLADSLCRRITGVAAAGSCEKLTAADRLAAKRNIGDKLRLHAIANM